MKKPHVTIETKTSYRIYIEQGRQRFLYALAGKPSQAKKYAKEAERQFAISTSRKKK
jgi:hypothetical protein